ncbi:MAG TPA: DUF3048 domain-containing protein [Streptosporangiaceae bacterium]|nr:DUF3048 domain-containing protein [Streptosporangiaceae bacterium]
MTARWRTILVAITVAVVAVATGSAIVLLVGRPGPVKVRPPPSPGTSGRAAPRPLSSPFTGEPVPSLRPVLAVKIDNYVLARPQTGLTRADIVYVLPVEGGLSRFLAIFSSHLPPVIGPVRSARQDDIELLRQFGRPAFAFSGAQPQLLPVVEHSRIVDLYDGVAGGYYRSPARAAPYNLYAHARNLAAEGRGATTAHDIGFRFGPAPPGGRATAAFSVSYPAASLRFKWSAGRQRWLVWMDGSPALTTDGGQLHPATVVIQYTTVRTSRFLEQGVRPPYAQSTGSGRAVVLRGGRAYDGRWSRPSAPSGTTFTLPGGKKMDFARGQVWVVLTAKG